MSQRERKPETDGGREQDAPTQILLIDDDEHFSQFVARFLRQQNFQITSASSGREGVRLALELNPDLVICDLNMPGMDGHAVLARLRRDAQLANVPFIFLTGEIQPEQIREGMNLGADDYLTKPVNPANLLRAVKARLARAHAGRRQREEQMERAIQMFATVMHDLRDPLFVVLGYTDLLKRGTPQAGTATDTSEVILARMQEAISRMQAIVSETLFLAKSKMQRLPFDPVPVDVRILCEQVIADQDRDSRLRFECRDQECSIVGDPLRLRQALENVLGNALKYSDGEVTTTLRRRTDGCSIEVEDRGIGIPEADRARVFDPFFRASNTDGKPGHGLGLSIVNTCIEQHGGQVTFVSEIGKGTTFTLELPAMPPAASEPPAQPTEISANVPPPPANGHAARDTNISDSASSSARLRGIIVDDDPLVRDVLRDLLTQSGEIQVVGEAGSVARARQLIEQCRPEAVFLDINLPDAKGFDLLPHLGPETAVVFVTSAEEYAVHAFDSDAVDYLLKPVNPERLKKALQRIRQRAAAASTAASDRLGLDDTFLVKTMSEKKLIKVRAVRSIAAYGEYSWVYWDGSRGALMRKPLKQWEAELPGNQFVRIHRNAIINLAFMERVEKLGAGRLQVRLRDAPEPLAVSLRLAPALNRKLKTFRA